MKKEAKRIFYTVPEMAVRLMVSTSTIYRLMDRQEIKNHRVGKSYRVKIEDFNNYLKEKGLA